MGITTIRLKKRGDMSKQKHIVIVGGGFAGLQVAKQLKKSRNLRNYTMKNVKKNVRHLRIH